MTFRVEAPKGAVVRWRRWGGSLLPYTSGRFSGTETFRIYPGELFLSFDLRADDPDLDVTIERVES